ncbi:hypothetical protein ACM1RC_08910 [Paenibacillus azoreducens]|uniref:hypothetical protein n=1 Tax=Paenibacillus azoreducens TaxID=116718 RepID=UPI0039F481EB
MRNPFYCLDKYADSWAIFNVFRPSQPVALLKNVVVEDQLLTLLEQGTTAPEHDWLRRLKARGIFIEEHESDFYSILREVIGHAEGFDPFALSELVLTELRHSNFQVIGDPCGLLNGLPQPSGNVRLADQILHYVVTYHNRSELNYILGSLKLDHAKSLILCRMEEGKCTEFGPVYQVEPGLCIPCLIEKQDSYKIIGVIDRFNLPHQFHLKEYVKVLVDIYSSYTVRLGQLHERKMLIADHRLSLTSAMNPICFDCKCMNDAKWGEENGAFAVQ